MGTHCSSELYRGHILKSKTTTMKLLLLTALAAVAMAEPEAEAGYYGYHPGFYGYYGHQLNWPGVRAPGFSSQCFGCRDKRSAEADAEPGYYGYPYGFYGYLPLAVGSGYEHDLPGDSSVSVKRTHLVGKRSAEADAEPGYYGYPYGLYGYPYFGYRGVATSFEARSPQGLRGKRSAEPGYYHPYGYYPYHFGYRAYGPGIAGHPTGTSFVARSPQGLGK